MFPIDKLSEMVEDKKVKSTKNIASIVINKKIQINYLYGAWMQVEHGNDETLSGYVNNYEEFIEMVIKKYPLSTIESFVLTS